MRAVRMLLSAAILAAPLSAQRRPDLPADKDPNDWASYYQHGLTLLPRRPDRAEKYFEYASRLDPGVAEPWVAWYAAWWRFRPQLWELQAQGDQMALDDREAKRTAEWMRKAFLINPFVRISLLIYTYPDEWRIRRDQPFFRGLYDFYEGRWLQSTQEFGAALQKNPDLWDGLFFSGLANVQMNRWGDAQRDFRALIDSISSLETRRTIRSEIRTYGAGFGAIKTPDVHYTLGLMYLLAGDLVQAKTAFQRTFEIDLSHSMAHMHYGTLLYNARDTASAIREYAMAVEMKPDDEVLRFNYGTILLTAGRVDSALAHFTEAVKLNPDYAPPYFNKALCHDRLGQTADARAMYQAFLDHAPLRLGEQIALARQRLGP